MGRGLKSSRFVRAVLAPSSDGIRTRFNSRPTVGAPMTWSAPQRYLAEFIGTFGLLLFGGGTAVFTLDQGDPLSRVAVVSGAFGLTIVGAVYALGDVSGGHFNPAVTLSMAMNKRMPARDVLPYLVAQVFGGLAGIAIVAGVASGSSGGWHVALQSGLGSQCYAGNGSGCGYSVGSVFLLELALTFVFVLVIQLVTRPESSARNLAPAAIGLTLVVTNLAGITIDGASINPARSFAPALVTTLAGGPMWPIDQAWLFVVAPILGGLLAAAVEMILRPRM